MSYYIIAGLAAVGVISSLYVLRRGGSRLTPLGGVAVGLALVGLFFAHNRTLGYSLIGIGVLLAIIDVINRGKSEPENNTPDQTEPPMPANPI